jgi:spermidine synthase
LRHSYVDLEDPTHLEFDYTRWMGEAIDDMAGGPLEAVFIGGGGFTLPRYVAATRPGSRSRVLEVDGDLVALARERLGLRTGPALAVDIGDARVTLRSEPTDSADLVVGDAFGGVAVPWHLTTLEFAEDIRRVLRPDGLYLLNVIDYEPLGLARAEAATLREVFEHVAVVGHPEPGGNHVFLASDAPLPPLPEARRLELAGGDALRDADAPADQLLTPAA